MRSNSGSGIGRVLRPLLLAPMLALPAMPAVAQPAPAPDKSDVRVLIDISGSMRQNDPNNLRRPALRMLAGLLQPDTRAGVWTFARWVNNLVPVAEVDAQWKQRTQSLSKQISSPGQFTNIEDVLDKASRDWQGQPDTHARHLVLLTDGMVDVSKDSAANDASRQRIIDTLLPRLQAAGAKVHTIALSARADHALMKRLAGETGGWYQQVDEAEQLQRVFLKMFEAVGKPDSVPLQDNRFTVDGSIQEATVLVFSKSDSPPVVLRSPQGDEFTDSDLPAGVAWYRDQGYDLITIDKPRKGEWSLQADVDPDNRVMIVTDLKLQTSELPTHLAVGEQVHVEAHLSNRGKLVDRQAFLRLLDVRADAITSDGTDPQALNDSGADGDERGGDGRYSMRFIEPQARDSVELLVSVDSPTFVREKRFRMAVHDIAVAEIADGDGGPVLTLSINRTVMQDEAEVEIWQQNPQDERAPLQPAAAGDGSWTAALTDPVGAVYARVSGTSRIGNLVERTLGPIMPPGVEPPAVVEAVPVVEPVAEPETRVAEAEAPPKAVAEPAPAADPEPAPEPDVSEEPEAEQGWVLPAAVFGGFNLLLLIGAGAWFFVRRKKGRADEDLGLDELLDDADGDATAAGDAQEKAA